MRSLPPLDGTCENSSDRWVKNDRPKSSPHHCRGVTLNPVARFTSVANKYTSRLHGVTFSIIFDAGRVTGVCKEEYTEMYDVEYRDISEDAQSMWT